MDQEHHRQDCRHQVRRRGHGERRAACRRHERHRVAQDPGRQRGDRARWRQGHQPRVQAPELPGGVQERPACHHARGHGRGAPGARGRGQPGPRGQRQPPRQPGRGRLGRRRRHAHVLAARPRAWPRGQDRPRQHRLPREPHQERLHPRGGHGGHRRGWRLLQHQRRRGGRARGGGHRCAQGHLPHRRRRRLPRLLRQGLAHLQHEPARDGGHDRERQGGHGYDSQAAELLFRAACRGLPKPRHQRQDPALAAAGAAHRQGRGHHDALYGRGARVRCAPARYPREPSGRQQLAHGTAPSARPIPLAPQEPRKEPTCLTKRPRSSTTPT